MTQQGNQVAKSETTAPGTQTPVSITSSGVHANSYLTYHRWLLPMVQQCRKDILFQNQVINKKLRQKITPFSTRFQSKLKQNKYRIGYFVGFCILFSMDAVYNKLVLENHSLKNLHKKIRNKIVRDQSSLTAQNNKNSDLIKNLGISQQKKQELGKLFLFLDSRLILNDKLMNKISKRNTMQANSSQAYPYGFVDIGSFVQFFKDQDVQEVKSRIKGEFPYLDLAY